MEFVYYNKRKDAINYDIFLHIIYISAERTRLELVTTCVTGRDSNQTELTFQKLNKIQKKVSLRAAANESISSKLRLRVYKNLGESIPL